MDNSMKNVHVMSVVDLIQHARVQLRKVSNVVVCGELGRVTESSKGHRYFEILGDNARMSCVMWASADACQIRQENSHVHVQNVDFYPPQGKCQLIVECEHRRKCG